MSAIKTSLILLICGFAWNLPRPSSFGSFVDAPRPCKRGHRMALLQSFLLGIMVAWTPSLVFLGWCLRHSITLEDEEVSATG